MQRCNQLEQWPNSKQCTDLDPCLFVSDKVIAVNYVDDTLFFSPKAKYIEEVMSKLRDEGGLELEKEDDVAGFLGVSIVKQEDDSILMTQSGLAIKIIETLQIDKLPRKFTPAERTPLVKDEEGEPPELRYNYTSVVGMLQYLQGHSRPDITFAVSQVARYTHNPKRLHEIALDRIGQYLKGTVNKGLILNPKESFEVDCFVDADFAGLWPHEDKLDPTCVRSRTGYVICLADCPIVWKSRLQETIATSTCMSEYMALSTSMKELLPLKEVLDVVKYAVGMGKENNIIHFKTTVWEDNDACRILANLEPGRGTSRTKFFAIKLHWFRSYLKPNHIEVRRINSCEQKADILTKGLGKQKFEEIRKLLCGW